MILNLKITIYYLFQLEILQVRLRRAIQADPDNYDRFECQKFPKRSVVEPTLYDRIKYFIERRWYRGSRANTIY